MGLVVGTGQEIENAMAVLPRRDGEKLRSWMENDWDDELEMTDKFAAKIQRAGSEMAGGEGQPQA